MGEPPPRTLYEILVRQNHRSLLAFANALTHGDEDLADELVQDSLVLAYERLADYDPGQDFAAWVRGIVRNRWRQHCQRHRRLRHLAVDSEAILADEHLEAVFAQLDATAAGPGSAVFEALEQCIATLTAPMASTIRNFYLEGQSLAQVATALACTIDAVKKRLQRGRQLLHDCLHRRLAGSGLLP